MIETKIKEIFNEGQAVWK